MLKVTDKAASLLKAAKAIDGPPDSGIRIRRGPRGIDGGIDIGFSFVDRPQSGDAQLEHHGLHIYLENSLIDLLDDRTLDVRDAEEGPLLVFH